MPVTSYSRTPSDNNSSPPNGWPENMAAASVNNTARQLMTDIVNEAGKGAARVLASVAGTNTITASMTPDLDAYAAGMIVVFTPANTNTGATTLNIDSLGALDVQKEDGNSLVSGDLVAGIPAVLVLDSGADDWILLNSASTAAGTYTPTLSNVANCSGAAVVAHRYSRIGSIVTLSGTITLTVTAGAATVTTVGVTVPVASNFSAASDASGSCTTDTSSTGNGWVAADTNNDRLEVTFLSGASGAQTLYFVGQYEIK